MKVLHLVENLHRGSVERWLVRSYRHGKRLGLPFEWTFHCYLPERGDLQQSAEEAGARVVHSPAPLVDKRRFLSAMRDEIRGGGYDVVHSHHDLLSAFYYAGSIGCGVRRITHVHNTDEIVPTRSRLKRLLARELMRRTCLAMSDRILATSDHALRMFLAGREPDPLRHRAHYCSIDLETILAAAPDRCGVRAELGLEPQAKLLLFVGSMIELKNPAFVVDVLAHLHALDPTFAAVFVGDGPDTARVVARAQDLGLVPRVRVLGWRDDVPRLMSAGDLFVNPRREQPLEGLGLVNVEAQAAGLRTLVSDGISPEPLLEGTLHTRLPLALGAAEWAKATRELLAKPALPCETTKQLLLKSPFNPDVAVKDLHSIYADLMTA